MRYPVNPPENMIFEDMMGFGPEGELVITAVEPVPLPEENYFMEAYMYGYFTPSGETEARPVRVHVNFIDMVYTVDEIFSGIDRAGWESYDIQEIKKKN